MKWFSAFCAAAVIAAIGAGCSDDCTGVSASTPRMITVAPLSGGWVMDTVINTISGLSYPFIRVNVQGTNGESRSFEKTIQSLPASITWYSTGSQELVFFSYEISADHPVDGTIPPSSRWTPAMPRDTNGSWIGASYDMIQADITEVELF